MKDWKEKRREEYLAKLRDPRWQKKRLEIMQRDEFACQFCYDTTKTLNIHHLYYERDKEPWEYPDNALVTLCEECHEEETALRPTEETLLRDVCRRVGISSSQLNALSHTLLDHGEDPTWFEFDFDLMCWLLRRFIKDKAFRSQVEEKFSEDVRSRSRKESEPAE